MATKTNRADGRYEIKKMITFPDGTKKPKSFYGKSKKEAQSKYLEYIRTQDMETTSRKQIYFSDLADKYLASSSAGDTTYVGYKQKVEIIKKKFPNRLADSITFEELKKYINSLSNYSENTVKKYVLHIKGIFTFGVDNDFLIKSPATKLKVPANCKAPKPPQWYTKTQARELINYAKKQGKKGLSVFIPLKAGTRPGETAALNLHRDVDLQDMTLTINETIKVPQSGLKVGVPKTRTSKRIIPIDKEFVNHLKHFMDVPGYLFDNGHGKPVNYNNFVNHYISPVMEGMPENFPRYTPHDLRHTFGTLLYESGTDLYDIMKIMGHSDIKVTQIYVHQTQEQLKKRIKRYY